MVDSEVPLTVNMGLNPCFVLLLRLKNCQDSSPLTHIMCAEKQIDYYECKRGDKRNQYRAWFALEFKKLKMLSLPKYDDVTDSFIDGDIPSSADSFFNNNERMKNFFKLHNPPTVKPEHHKDKEMSHH